ncbi:M48 family metalloprotease [Suttonella sp. R2A3]|uniref:M48 family metalloprotease n=1 Tax=Suttonella sp. R2A3 TaxID=2908648 RepID=UPI001F438F8B|nr:M48 family metalloprotease [Suttonella sp. R2A3]UJF24766.1 M48 family metalloprotease [Suttonella sp. R2A3]
MPSSTLFQLHHQEALRTSKRLNRYFWFGAMISGLFYAVISFWLIQTIFGSNHWLVDLTNPKIWLPSAAFTTTVLITLLYGYYEARRRYSERSAIEHLAALGGELVRAVINPRDRQLINVVEEMAIAAGVLPPTTMVLRRDLSINALVMGGANNSIALAVSQGALNYLTRDELQALVAHEIGHIVNEDIAIYSKLSAMLYGYYLLSEFRHRKDEHVHTAPEKFWHLGDIRGVSNVSIVISELIGFSGIIMMLYGRFMQAKFAREREWMADARSVQFTRHSEALVMTLKKALALKIHNGQLIHPARAQQHFLFLLYHEAPSLFATHPPLEERISRYGTVAKKEELEAIVFKMRQQMSKSDTDKPQIQHKALFTASIIYPLLIAQEQESQPLTPLDTPTTEHREAAILSFFIYHSTQTLFELRFNNIIDQHREAHCARYLKHLSEVHPLAQLPLFTHYLHDSSPEEHRAIHALRQQIKLLIQLDHEFSFFEWCYYLILRNFLSSSSEQTLDYRAVQVHIEQVLALCASLSSENEAKQNAYYLELCTQCLPLSPQPYTAPLTTPQSRINSSKAVLMLRQLKPIYRQQLRYSLNTFWENQERLTLPALYLRYTLNQCLQ